MRQVGSYDNYLLQFVVIILFCEIYCSQPLGSDETCLATTIISIYMLCL